MSDPDHQRIPRRQHIPRRVLFRRRFHGVTSPPLQRFADSLSARVLKGKDFACLLTGEEEIAALNKEFRGKADVTDVLSFPSVAGHQMQGYAGDVAISVPHARLHARALGHSLEQEICVLMLHGVLHLAGMDHETDNGAMRRAEKRLRREFGLPATLTERAVG